MSAELQIRVATLEDLPVVNAIKRAASLVAEDYRESLLAHPELLTVSPDEVGAGDVLIAEMDAEGVGVIAVSTGDHLEITGLFVNPAEWKRGIGRRLLDDAVARRAGTTAVGVEVTASPDAEPFYRRCGFVTIGEASTRFGPGVLMRRG